MSKDIFEVVVEGRESHGFQGGMRGNLSLLVGYKRDTIKT